MSKAICVGALLALAATGGCTPRMAVAATAGLLVGAALAAAADHHEPHRYECPPAAHCYARTIIVHQHAADPWEYDYVSE